MLPMAGEGAEKGEGAGGEGKAGRRKGAFKRPWGCSLGTQRAQLLLGWWRRRLAAQLIGRLEEAAREEPAPGTHRGSGKQEEGWWWRAGKDGTEERQRHTRGRQGKRPEQERTSQPLCAQHARFLLSEDTQSSHFSVSVGNKHTCPLRQERREAGPSYPSELPVPGPYLGTFGRCSPGAGLPPGLSTAPQENPRTAAGCEARKCQGWGCEGCN